MYALTLITGREKIKEGFQAPFHPLIGGSALQAFHIFLDRTIDRKSHTPSTVAMT